MSLSAAGGWRPRYVYEGRPLAGVLAWQEPGGAEIATCSDAAGRGLLAARAFLIARLHELSTTSESEFPVNFLYVLVRRESTASDEIGVIAPGSPVAEFGYGGPPSSPEDWPVVPLRALMTATINALAFR